jgi:hypothetical protein
VACPSDHQIRHIHDLPIALPWLWEGQQPPVLAAPDCAAAAEDGEAAAVSAKASAAARAKVGGSASSESEHTIEAVYATA